MIDSLRRAIVLALLCTTILQAQERVYTFVWQAPNQNRDRGRLVTEEFGSESPIKISVGARVLATPQNIGNPVELELPADWGNCTIYRRVDDEEEKEEEIAPGENRIDLMKGVSRDRDHVIKIYVDTSQNYKELVERLKKIKKELEIEVDFENVEKNRNKASLLLERLPSLRHLQELKTHLFERESCFGLKKVKETLKKLILLDQEVWNIVTKNTNDKEEHLVYIPAASGTSAIWVEKFGVTLYSDEVDLEEQKYEQFYERLNTFNNSKKTIIRNFPYWSRRRFYVCSSDPWVEFQEACRKVNLSNIYELSRYTQDAKNNVGVKKVEDALRRTVQPMVEGENLEGLRGHLDTARNKRGEIGTVVEDVIAQKIRNSWENGNSWKGLIEIAYFFPGEVSTTSIPPKDNAVRLTRNITKWNDLDKTTATCKSTMDACKRCKLRDEAGIEAICQSVLRSRVLEMLRDSKIPLPDHPIPLFCLPENKQEIANAITTRCNWLPMKLVDKTYSLLLSPVSFDLDHEDWRAFCFVSHKITRGQYCEFLKENFPNPQIPRSKGDIPYFLPSVGHVYYDNGWIADVPDSPMTMVSMAGAQAYVDWLSNKHSQKNLRLKYWPDRPGGMPPDNELAEDFMSFAAGFYIELQIN